MDTKIHFASMVVPGDGDPADERSLPHQVAQMVTQVVDMNEEIVSLSHAFTGVVHQPNVVTGVPEVKARHYEVLLLTRVPSPAASDDNLYQLQPPA